jgi:hypothetical protein
MSSAGQVVGSDKSTWPCGGHPKLLRDENGTPVWIDSDELKKRAIRQVEPKPPFHGNVDATIVVDVLIDTTGTIKCERTTSGHPLLRKISERAARDQFRRQQPRNIAQILCTKWLDALKYYAQKKESPLSLSD